MNRLASLILAVVAFAVALARATQLQRTSLNQVMAQNDENSIDIDAFLARVVDLNWEKYDKDKSGILDWDETK